MLLSYNGSTRVLHTFSGSSILSRSKTPLKGSILLINSMICERCGKEFFEDWRKDKNCRKVQPRFCSRSCANAHNHSTESKQKTANSLRLFYDKKGRSAPKKCKVCGKTTRASKSGLCRSCLNQIMWTPERRAYYSRMAQKRELGGWHTSKRFKYKDFCLDSEYEVCFAKSLDAAKIKWSRPSFFRYIKSDKTEHRYYPDFYLDDYDVYVDTKNDYLINNVNPHTGLTDLEKIKLVEEQNSIRVIVLDKDHLSFEAIKNTI